MMKRLLSLLLTLAILLGAMPGLAETAVPVLHYAEIASLKALRATLRPEPRGTRA